jgi:hypothetical protein
VASIGRPDSISGQLLNPHTLALQIPQRSIDSFPLYRISAANNIVPFRLNVDGGVFDGIVFSVLNTNSVPVGIVIPPGNTGIASGATPCGASSVQHTVRFILPVAVLFLFGSACLPF